MCATQDIAVDGWALTLLTPSNVSYASTAQTVGLTAGHFMSYTVFLALNASDFANKWFRTVPSDDGLVSHAGYLTFWGWMYIIVTKAKHATRDGATPERQFPGMLSTTFNIERKKLKAERSIPEKVAKYSKSIDIALPGEIKHFLFRCPKWETYRREMTECTETQRGNLSFYLGGKSPLDGPKWKPNMKAVQATIRFTMATGRLNND